MMELRLQIGIFEPIDKLYSYAVYVIALQHSIVTHVYM